MDIFKRTYETINGQTYERSRRICEPGDGNGFDVSGITRDGDGEVICLDCGLIHWSGTGDVITCECGQVGDVDGYLESLAAGDW